MGVPPLDNKPCTECGLFHPCKTCGGSARPRLSVVRPGWSRDEVLAAMRKAFELGNSSERTSADAPEITALLEDLVP